MWPSPGVNNGIVAMDAEFMFARGNGGTPNWQLQRRGLIEVSLDGGKTWLRPTTSDEYNAPDHSYTYDIVGNGQPLQVRLNDTHGDNYGVLRVQVQDSGCCASKVAFAALTMAIVYEKTQIDKQKRKSDKIDFLTALERAVRSLLNDPADQERPNAANQVRDNRDGVPKDADAELLQRYIRAHMNQNKLRLLSEDSPEKSDLDESTKDNWVFLLDKGMGDRHWIVVDRMGARAAYQEIT